MVKQWSSKSEFVGSSPTLPEIGVWSSRGSRPYKIQIRPRFWLVDWAQQAPHRRQTRWSGSCRPAGRPHGLTAGRPLRPTPPDGVGGVGIPTSGPQRYLFPILFNPNIFKISLSPRRSRGDIVQRPPRGDRRGVCSSIGQSNSLRNCVL